MRIHSNLITSPDAIRGALTAEKLHGRIALATQFKTLTVHRSHSHDHAYEVQLENVEKIHGDGRKIGNSGSYGAGENWAATFDEWGWLLAALYCLDADMVAGPYRSRYDFDDRTALTYNPGEWQRQYRLLGFDPYPVRVSRPLIGRRGFGRVDGNDLPAYAFDHWAFNEPRTPEWIREFANPTHAGVSA